jgi:hypothetical protein
MSLLDEVNAQIEQELSAMTPDQIKAEFEKLAVERERRKAKQAEYNAKPEVAEKRKAYSKQYREKDPEAFLAKRKAYQTRPDVVEKRKAYTATRNARIKALLAKAKEMGLDKTAEQTTA